MNKKIGIMGGTFNPIHNGHLILAESAYEQFHLDTVVFLPSGNPPHKADISYIDSQHRCNMVELAIKDNSHFEMSLEEVLRPGITYTSDTLLTMKSNDPYGELFFIIGADSLYTFETWHEPDVICRQCTILVATREGHDSADVEEKIEELRNRFEADIFRIVSPDFDISSRLVRERIISERSIRYFVPRPVEEYIREHGLYA
ncbi:MAG: nicotinate-nucleotide adenylyltransferase [Lachnospiraceae bacterium]|nr:nicotinate-nucleotide adenylyltransferase [Lachnospiraceae bacterium]